MDDKVLEPLKYYDKQGEQEHSDNTTSYLQGLVDRSGVDVEANRQTMAAWKREQETIASLSKTLRKYKRLRGLLIFGIVVGAILALGGSFPSAPPPRQASSCSPSVSAQ